MKTPSKKEIAARVARMESTFYHCPTCDVVRLGRNTLPTLESYGHLAIFARECPDDATRLDVVKDEDVDLSIVDYLAVP